MLGRNSFLACLSCLFCCQQVVAGENLALHKSYTIFSRPDYGRRIYEMDMTKLTNGKTYSGRLTGKDSVGWRAMAAAPEITIDLGIVQHLGKIRVHCIEKWSAHVGYPRFIVGFVSKNGERFEYAGSLIATNAPQEGKYSVSRWFTIGNLGVEGRFIKVLIEPSNKHLFLDEIEVIRGAEKPTKKVRVGPDFTGSDATDRIASVIRKQTTLNEKIAATIEAAAKHRQILGGSFADKAVSELNSIEKKLASQDDAVSFSQQLPLLSREVGNVRANMYRKVYEKSYVCIVANPMETLYEKEMLLTPGKLKDRIDIELWQAEHESVGINILNCSNDALKVSADLLPMTGPKEIVLDGSKTFIIRRAIYVDGRKVGSIADPLVLHDDSEFNIEPGDTLQLWVSVFNPTLKPGVYTAKIVVKARTSDTYFPAEVLKINMRVEPFKLELDIALSCFAWAYPLNHYKTIDSQTAAIRDLQLHYTNVVVAHGNCCIPFPRKQPAGKGNSISVDYSRIDQLIQRNSYARTYLFFLNFNDKKKISIFGEWMTPGWKRNFSLWLKDWVEHLKNIGVGYDKFAIYPFDERLHDRFYELAKLIKETDANIRIFANSFGKGPSDFMRFEELIDIWCPKVGHCVEHPRWLKMIKGFRKEVWTYRCSGPGKANHPYSYYRLMSWWAFKHGMTGVGFWTYVDDGYRHSWDGAGYAVVYDRLNSPVDTSGENVIPSRRWEAWREGIEDYQYLYELQKAIDLAMISNPKKAGKAQNTLNAQVNYVLARSEDCDAVYRARQKITAALYELTGGKLE